MLLAGKIFSEISYQQIVDSVKSVMAENFADFAADQMRFKETTARLGKELEEYDANAVGRMADAVERQIGSMVLFSFFLGLKANWDHFVDPVGNTFLDVDTETYLREDMARRLPDYQYARQVLEQFYTDLSPEQQDRYEDIASYICHLETVGPKLAHYQGYLLGNRLFSRIVPGYGEDLQLTLRYRHTLEDYFGIDKG